MERKRSEESHDHANELTKVVEISEEKNEQVDELMTKEVENNKEKF